MSKVCKERRKMRQETSGGITSSIPEMGKEFAGSTLIDPESYDFVVDETTNRQARLSGQRSSTERRTASASAQEVRTAFGEMADFTAQELEVLEEEFPYLSAVNEILEEFRRHFDRNESLDHSSYTKPLGIMLAALRIKFETLMQTSRTRRQSSEAFENLSFKGAVSDPATTFQIVNERLARLQFALEKAVKDSTTDFPKITDFRKAVRLSQQGWCKEAFKPEVLNYVLVERDREVNIQGPLGMRVVRK